MADIEVKKIVLDMPEQEELPEDPRHPTLRHATLNDIPELMKLARKLFKGSPMEAMRIDIEKARAQLERAIISDHKDNLVLVSHDEGKIVGVIAAYAFYPIFSSERIACEILWYLEPEYRKGRRGLDMMKAYEYWAKLVGCTVAQYGWLTSSPETMIALYEKTGATLAEHVYYKVLV